MKALTAGVILVLVSATPLFAQDPTRSLERIALELEKSSPTFTPRKIGIVTIMPTVLPGEVFRVSVPVGELVMKAVRGVSASNRRRQEAAARRKVEAELRSFKEQKALRP